MRRMALLAGASLSLLCEKRLRAESYTLVTHPYPSMFEGLIYDGIGPTATASKNWFDFACRGSRAQSWQQIKRDFEV